MKAVLTRGADAERLGEAPNQTWLIADADHTDGIMNVVRTTLGPGVDGPPPHFHKESPEATTRRSSRNGGTRCRSGSWSCWRS